MGQKSNETGKFVAKKLVLDKPNPTAFTLFLQGFLSNQTFNYFGTRVCCDRQGCDHIVLPCEGYNDICPLCIRETASPLLLADAKFVPRKRYRIFPFIATYKTDFYFTLGLSFAALTSNLAKAFRPKTFNFLLQAPYFTLAQEF